MNYPDLPKWQLIAVPAVSIILGVFYFGKYFVAEELILARQEIKSLEQDLQTTQDLLAREQSRLSVAEAEVDIVRRANSLLRKSERERQDEISSLQADLDFYRRLGGANGSQAPLTLHYLEIQPTKSPRVYRVLFSLTQNLRWASNITGRIQLGIDGIRNGVAEHLTNKHLLAESAAPLSFQFKHFQQLECLITLPEGYEPSRLTIQLRSRSLKTPVEQSMEWDTLINQQAVDAPEEETPLSQRDVMHRILIEKSTTNRHS
jgi:hypothetical protein